MELLLEVRLCSSTTLLRMPASSSTAPPRMPATVALQPVHLLWKGNGYQCLTPSQLSKWLACRPRQAGAQDDPRQAGQVGSLTSHVLKGGHGLPGD